MEKFALEKANESMKAYYSYPPEKVIAAKKLKFQQRLSDRQFILQLVSRPRDDSRTAFLERSRRVDVRADRGHALSF